VLTQRFAPRGLLPRKVEILPAELGSAAGRFAATVDGAKLGAVRNALQPLLGDQGFKFNLVEILGQPTAEGNPLVALQGQAPGARALTAPTATASTPGHDVPCIEVTDPSYRIPLRARVGQLFDEREDLRALAKCESGYTKNLFEFARHSLGQIKAKNPEQRCYDLAYLLAYAGDRKPLPVQPGPATLVTLVHACCAANPSIPVSLDDFRHHLREYALHVPAGELVSGKTGKDLAMLGLVVDSPDAAGGRLLVPPF